MMGLLSWLCYVMSGRICYHFNFKPLSVKFVDETYTSPIKSTVRLKILEVEWHKISAY